MKASRTDQCVSCYREIQKGSEVQYSKARRGIRHGVCPPITTEELQAGRAIFEAKQQADAELEEIQRYARFDAANPTWSDSDAVERARAMRTMTAAPAAGTSLPIRGMKKAG